MSAILEVTGACKRFGGIKAVDAAEIEVQSGQIHGLIGPNGAGKTTFFNLITGLYQADSGEFLLDGLPYSPRNPHEVAAAGIARTFQNIRLFRSMSVLHNVIAGRHLHTRGGFWDALLRTPAQKRAELEAKDRAGQLLQSVGLERFAGRLAGTLSYGDQRRLEIARAMAMDPKLLALDEPAAGMNTNEKAQLSELLERIREQGTTILIIEHDVAMVMGICDEVTVFDRGRRLVNGTPAQVTSNPAVIEAYLGPEDEV